LEDADAHRSRPRAGSIERVLADMPELTNYQ
jgi:hypothetical protein